MRNISKKEELYEKLYNAIMIQDVEEAAKVAQVIVETKADAEKGIARATEAMVRLGEMFDNGEIFLPQVVIATDAMKAASNILIPACPTASKVGKLGKVIIGTIEGDIHDVGKCIVAAMLKSVGFEVIDLGRDVLIKNFIEKTKEMQPDIVGVSALMTATRIGQKVVIEMLAKENMKSKVKVMIGGSATSGEWAQQIGADAWGEDAPDAVRKALKLVAK